MSDNLVPLFNRAEDKKRVGRFEISRRYIDERPNEALKIMSRCIIVRAECLWASDVIEYVAISPDFDELPPNLQPPLYECQVDDGLVKFIKSDAR